MDKLFTLFISKRIIFFFKKCQFGYLIQFLHPSEKLSNALKCKQEI